MIAALQRPAFNARLRHIVELKFRVSLSTIQTNLRQGLFFKCEDALDAYSGGLSSTYAELLSRDMTQVFVRSNKYGDTHTELQSGTLSL